MMTQTWPLDRCPNCGEDRGAPLTDDVRLCFACRHEWEPAKTSGPLPDATFATAPAPAPLQPDLVTYVEPPPEVDPVELARARFVGATAVVHELEVEGTIDRITDDGAAIIVFGSGYEVEVDPDGFSVVAYPEVDDGVVSMLASVDMGAAAQIIRAAVASFDGDGDGRTIGMPPDGFLPADAEMMPVIEHGAAYAVALVAFIAGVSTDDLAALAARLDNAAEAAKGATSGNKEQD